MSDKPIFTPSQVKAFADWVECVTDIADRTVYLIRPTLSEKVKVAAKTLLSEISESGKETQE